MWDQDSGKVRNQKSLEEVVSLADMVFFCIPSFALEDVLKKIKKSLRKGCIVVSPIKGIDHVTGNTTAEVVIKSLPGQPFVMLGGPMIAEELDKDLGGTAVLASREIKAARSVGLLFGKSGVNVSYSDDIHGVGLAGVLKNAYALSLGIAEGLGWGMNLRGALIAQALLEMQIYLFAAGCKPETAIGVAGLGDLIATGLSHNSRNHSVGLLLAKGKSPRFKGEGGLSLPSLLALITKKKKSLAAFPLLVATAKVVAKKSTARKAFQSFRAHGGK
jgi:glycerol-3-phosphate dehydrogenase (NAD(P)+)